MAVASEKDVTSVPRPRSDALLPRCSNAEVGQTAPAVLTDRVRRHPERIFQWAENRSVPAENNMSERGVRRTVIARKVCGGSQNKDALMVREVLQSVIESLRLRYADPAAFRKNGKKPHVPFCRSEVSEGRLRLRTRPFEKAQMHFCSDAQMPRSVKTAQAVLTDRVLGDVWSGSR